MFSVQQTLFCNLKPPDSLFVTLSSADAYCERLSFTQVMTYEKQDLCPYSLGSLENAAVS